MYDDDESVCVQVVGDEQRRGIEIDIHTDIYTKME